jgi:cytosine/adenosine deaminase-related metal-dependent hydrolase
MGFGFPATGRLLRAGLRPGLGVDVVTSTGSDLFIQMRAALQAQRVLALAGGYSPECVEGRFSEAGGLSLLSDYGDRAMSMPDNRTRDTAQQSPP